MKYRQVGKSGLRVSEISIGGWITFGSTVQDETAHDILKEALDHGVNFIDVADVYAKGESERVVGEFIKDLDRSKLVVSSKVYWPMSEDINDRGLSRKHIFESVEKSLKRLHTDYLDLYFCHRFDETVPLEETLRAMDDLVSQGKILYWGTSMWSDKQLERVHELAVDHHHAYVPTVEQPRYSLFHREIEQGVMQTAEELGMGLVVWSPLAQGLLTGKYNDGVPKGSRAATSSWLDEDLNEENIKRARQFSALAQDLQIEPSQLALAWCLRRPQVSSVITGASSTRQVRENLAASELKLDDETIKRLDAIF